MWDSLFQAAWFGPFAIPNPYYGNEDEEMDHPGLVYNDGPLDGLKTASMQAQWFSQLPIMSAYQGMHSGMMGSRSYHFTPYSSTPSSKNRSFFWR